MTRLSSYRQRQLNRKALFYVVGLIALVIFISTIGFNLLIRTSIFLGELGGGGKKTENSDSAFFGSLEVDTPPIATNSAKMAVSGYVSGYDTITISINDRKVKTIRNESSFNEVIGDLKKGQNSIDVIAKSSKKKGEVKKESYVVLFKDEKPKLEVSEPADGTKTSSTEIKVSGKTDPDTAIRVNDSPVVVDVQGNFQTFFRLKDGENKIKIVAADVAGNTETKELTVTFDKNE